MGWVRLALFANGLKVMCACLVDRLYLLDDMIRHVCHVMSVLTCPGCGVVNAVGHEEVDALAGTCRESLPSLAKDFSPETKRYGIAI